MGSTGQCVSSLLKKLSQLTDWAQITPAWQAKSPVLLLSSFLWKRLFQISLRPSDTRSGIPVLAHCLTGLQCAEFSKRRAMCCCPCAFSVTMHVHSWESTLPNCLIMWTVFCKKFSEETTELLPNVKIIQWLKPRRTLLFLLPLFFYGIQKNWFMEYAFYCKSISAPMIHFYKVTYKYWSGTRPSRQELDNVCWKKRSVRISTENKVKSKIYGQVLLHVNHSTTAF
jgi:hypothetical protein